MNQPYSLAAAAAPCPHPARAGRRLLLPALRGLLPLLLLLLGLAATTAQAQTTTTYAYTGGPQTYTVPAGVTGRAGPAPGSTMVSPARVSPPSRAICRARSIPFCAVVRSSA